MTMQRYTRSQFLGSTIGQPVLIAGKVALTAPVAAVLVDQGITYTAVALGSSGNSITIEYTDGAVAGSEVVTVVGNAISVQIDDGVSSITNIVTAVNLSVPAALLVTASGAGVTGVNLIAVTPLAGGDNGIGSNNFGELISSVARSGVGEYTLTLSDKYYQEQYVGFKLLAATAVDLIPQVKSISVSSAKTIVVNMLAGATPTDILADTSLVMDAVLNLSTIR